MKTDDWLKTSASELVGSSVLDRQGYVLGIVQAVKPYADHQFALVVPFFVSSTEVDDLLVESHHLTEVNLQTQVIRTDLDANLVTSQRGKTIPLWAEKLVVNRQRRSLGEVVVRKVIETDWVKVPIYREKLVVQKTGQPEPLLEVSLGETCITGEAKMAATLESSNQANHHLPATTSQRYSLEEALQVLPQITTDKAQPISLIFLLDNLDNNNGSGLEQIWMEFPSGQTAAQTLMILQASWAKRCEGVILRGQVQSI